MTQLKKSSILLLLFAFTGCTNSWMEEKKDPLPGERIPILSSTQTLGKLGLHTPQLPATIQNKTWPSMALGVMEYPNPALLQNLAEEMRFKMRAANKNLAVVTTPVVANNTLFTLEPTGEVVAFDWQTGQEKWRNKQLFEPDSFWSERYYSGGLLYYAGILYVTSGSDRVVALEADTGQIKWSHKLNGLSRAIPVIISGTLVLQTIEGSAYGLDLNNGNIKWLHWSSGTEVSILSSSYAIANGDLALLQFTDQGVAAYDAKRHKEVWARSFTDITYGDFSSTEHFTNYTPAYSNGILYTYGKNVLAAIKSTTADILWKIPLAISAPIMVSGDTIYALAKQNGNYILVAIHKTNGSISWITELSPHNDTKQNLVFNSPFVAGSLVGLADNQGNLRWFNAINGQYQNSLNIDKDVYTRPIVVDNTLLVTSANGNIVRYAARGKNERLP